MVQPLLARVHNGRLVLDEATDLPEGSVVELIAADDDVDSSELDASIARGLAQADRGETVSAADVLRRLRTK
jgi:predicted transcriptional regulator